MSADELNTERILYLDGGLVTSYSPRLLDQTKGFASDILNIDFTKPGIPTKRPGTTVLYDPPTGETINNVFEYLKTSTGDRYVLISTDEGNVYYWHTVNLEWTLLVEDLTENTTMWFINFADRVVFCNGTDTLMSWDGTTVESSLGGATASMETFFPYDNADLVFTAVDEGTEGNYIDVVIEEPDTDTASASVEVTGTGTSSDHYVITVTLEWSDRVPYKSGITLDSPTGGTYELGSVFEKRTLAYDASAADIKQALELIYGTSDIDTVEVGTGEYDFEITFTDTVVDPYIRADFDDLEYAVSGDPSVTTIQEFEWDEVLSTGADIKTLLNADADVSALITTDFLTGSDGTGVVAAMSQRSLSGGYTAPSGKYLTMFKNRIIMVEDDDLIVASHTGDPTLWDPDDSASNSFSAYIGTNDGTTITGLLDMGDGGLLIGKTSSIYGMFGYTRENFVVDVIDTEVGIISHKTMQYVKPYTLFVAKDGVYRYEIGNTPERISDPIRDIFDDLADHDNIADSSSCVYNKQYVVTLPAEAGGVIVLVYYPMLDRWSIWDQPNSFITGLYLDFDNKVIFVDNDTGKVVLTDHTISTDGGEDQEIMYTSMELDAGYPERDKYFGELYIVFRTADNPYTVTVEVAFNGEDFYSITPQEETISGTVSKQKVLRIPLAREARFMEIKLLNADDARHFSPIAMFYTYQMGGLL